MLSPQRIASYIIISLFTIIIVIGNINMWSISKKLGDHSYFDKYSLISIFSILSFFIGNVIGRKSYKLIFWIGVITFITGLALLILVDFYGTTIFGAKRWVYIGGMSIQPTEIIKVPIAIISAYLLASYRPSKFLLISPIIFIIPIALIADQPDYGSALIIFLIFYICIILSEIPLKITLSISAIILVISPIVLWNWGLKEYHKERIRALLNPEENVLTSAYQTIQSKIAIATGGLKGVGFAQGYHSSGKWIPNLPSDFAFVSIAEDFGFIGVSLTLILLFGFIASLLYKAFVSSSRFPQLLLSITAGILAEHTTINLFMLVGIIPVIGIPLTLISHAGTHNVSISFLIGICYGIRDEEKRFKFIHYDEIK